MNLGDKLKACPFCGRKMKYFKESRTAKSGKEIITQYFMHEEYEISDGDCILDAIDMPFTIPAGDANEEIGYIGSYAEMWNTRYK